MFLGLILAQTYFSQTKTPCGKSQGQSVKLKTLVDQSINPN